MKKPTLMPSQARPEHSVFQAFHQGSKVQVHRQREDVALSVISSIVLNEVTMTT